MATCGVELQSHREQGHVYRAKLTRGAKLNTKENRMRQNQHKRGQNGGGTERDRIGHGRTEDETRRDGIGQGGVGQDV